MRKLLIVLFLLGLALNCPHNCNDCAPSGNVCFACGEGFQLRVNGTCVKETTIPYCTLYGAGAQEQCFVCQPTYSVLNGKCVKDGSACLVPNSQDIAICDQCGFGTVQDKGNCIGTINCAQKQTPCTSCIKGFFKDQQRCMDIGGNCMKIDTNGLCVTCNQGYNLIGYRCVPQQTKIYACYIWDQQQNCVACKSGYNIFQGHCLLPSERQQILQGVTDLATIISQHKVSITTTTTTTTTTTANGFDGFGNGGFNGFGDSTTTTTNTNNGNTGNTGNNGGFGGFGGFDSGSSGFGSSTTTTTTSSNTGGGSSGFGNGGFGGFGGGSSGGGSGGFGTSGSSTTSSTSSTTTTTNNNGFGGSTSGFGGGSGSGSGSGFGTSSTSQPPALPPNCQVPDRANQGLCLTCNQGYYPSSGICTQISPFCDAANILTGQCITCKYNLFRNNGKCIDNNCLDQGFSTCNRCKQYFAPNTNGVCQFSDPNCIAPLPARCGDCAAGYFITLEGFCKILPANCVAANIQTHDCLQCVNGYQVSNGACVAIQVQVVQQLPPNCQVASAFNPNLCSTCNTGYTNDNGVCKKAQTPSTPNCMSYNLITGICIQCNLGFELNRTTAQCFIPIPPQTPQGGSGNTGISGTGTSGSSTSTSTSTSTTSVTISGGGGPAAGTQRDPNCLKYVNNVCTDCSNRYYFGNNNKCVPVNPLCKDYTSNGACTSCYPGYQVSGGTCILSGASKDPFCKNYNVGGICTACYAGYFYNQAAAACKPMNPLCKTSNIVDGSCTNCFPGYTLRNGNCQIAFQDPNCKKFDPTKTVCLNCSARFYLGTDGKCKQVNPLCKTADMNTGACKSCYPGYVLQGTKCVLGGASNMDVNCAQFVNGICIKCSSGYYPSNGACQQLNPLCKTSNLTNGACLTCYPGYVKSGRDCLVGSSNAANGDPNCKGTDATGRCTGCYQGYYLSPQATCLRLDPLCKNYTALMNQCAGCYDGYSLFQGKCVISTQVPSANNDPFCISSQGIYCLTCANGYFLHESGKCKQLNPLCKKSDMATGQCTDCYKGYTRSQGTCIVAAAVNIPFCNKVVGIACVQCISGYYVNNGGCQLVNVLCATYDPNDGTCWSCVPGYVYQDYGCILPSMGIDPYCTWYTNSFCSQCMQGFALVNYVCTAVDPNCSDFDNIQNVCRQCRNGMTAEGPKCV